MVMFAIFWIALIPCSFSVTVFVFPTVLFSCSAVHIHTPLHRKLLQLAKSNSFIQNNCGCFALPV